MWVAHFAPGLVLSRFAPKTPLSLLAFAGAIPDFLFFVFAIFGIEKVRYHDQAEDPSYTSPTGGPGSHCFPYDCDYPYTHSLTGEIVIGLLFAGAVTLLYRLPSKSFLALFIATLTHYPLDLMVHRHDVAITTSEPPSQRHGFPLFDYPIVLFTVDTVLFLAPLWFHLRTANPGQNMEKRKKATAAYIVAALGAVAVEANFAFMGAPTTFVRAIHAPIFVSEILGIAWALGRLEDHTNAAGKRTLSTQEAKEALKKMT